MPRDGSATHEKILDAALDLVLGYGYAATTLDRILDRAQITKGTFFYHFDGKADLAHALIERFAESDRAVLENSLAQAEAASDDPLEQVLALVRLFEEGMGSLDAPYPGCLFASYVSESELFEERTLKVARDALELWRTELGRKFEEVIAAYPPRRQIDAASLADALTVVFEGSFVLSKSYGRADVVGEHLAHYRRYLELLFTPSLEPRRSESIDVGSRE